MKTIKVVAVTSGVILLSIVALGYGFVSSEGLSARKKPSSFEYAIANFALRASIPSEMKRLRDPLTPAPEMLDEAREHCKHHCEVCHGMDGAGKTTLAAGLSPEVPDLRAKHVQELTDGELFYIIKNGVRFTAMPGWDFADEHTWRLENA
jgi:Cytochrome C oxidase, cbb3-type, subunit III